MQISADIIVVGAGHAGCEAALAAARMGRRTLLLTIHLDHLAQMSCNPAIGGLAKGQLVREIDALGGEMAKVADETCIQFRMLNTSKGPAVRSPRAQADRHRYQAAMKRRLEAQPNLALLQDMAEALLVEGRRVVGVRGRSGTEYRGRAVVLTTGTFLRGLIHVGDAQFAGGRLGEMSAEKLSASLAAAGLKLGRLKTGTPPRLNGRTVDYDCMELQPGDEGPAPFSFSTEKIDRPQVPCHLTSTNARTHEIIRESLDRAPLFTGQIQATGPRYCPSVELKIVQFPDKEHHQVFIEPEGADTLEVYCNGLATSIPADAQDEMVHSIRGLERAQIIRYGYAIEYDFVPPTQLWPHLECKQVEGLFLAGQINGTSGYEEAAGQGIMAGINAVLKLRGEAPFVLGRHEAYIGVLIDDLVTKGTEEPYRMFTSRAEYRLLLRQDNADRRLMPYGHRYGLIRDEQMDRVQEKERAIAETIAYLEEKRHGPDMLAKLLRRPEVRFDDLLELDAELAGRNLPQAVREQVEIEIKYAGYITRQQQQIEKFQRMENQSIPADFDFEGLTEIRAESRDKLAAVGPRSLGQASRISGVSPADISVLMVHLARR